MAITRHGATAQMDSNGSSSMSGSFGSLPAEGSLIVVPAHFFASSARNWNPDDCTDNQGNKYCLAATAHVGEPIWFCVTGPTAGTFTITIDLVGTGGFDGSAVGINASSDVGTLALLGRSTASGSSTTPNTGNTGTLTASQAFLVASMQVAANQGSITVNGSWTAEITVLNDSTSWPGASASRIVTGSSAQSCDWVNGTSGAWTCSIVAFVEAAATGGGGGGGASRSRVQRRM